MTQAERVLYQFPVSHFCEKSRWCLDHKQLPFDAHNLMPMAHRLLTQRKAKSNTLPMLQDGPNWVAGSTAIALYLDGRYPELPLVSRDPLLREQVMKLEQDSVQLGELVRRWVYLHLLDQPIAKRLLMGEHRWLHRTEALSWPLMVRTLKKMYQLEPQTGPDLLRQIGQQVAAFEQLLLANGGRYLAGHQLSLADIGAASVTAPLLALAQTPWVPQGAEQLPAMVVRVREQLLERPWGQYVARLYQTERNARVDWHGQ